MKDIRFVVRVRNNILCRLREELGYGVYKMAEAIGIPGGIYSSYECMRTKPITRKGDIKTEAQRILNFHNLEFYQIWTKVILETKKLSETYEIDAHSYLYSGEAPAIIGVQESVDKSALKTQVDSVLETLKPREEFIVESYYGLNGREKKTPSEIGEDFDISRSRVDQILQTALRKLRHPERSKKLRPFLL